MFFGKRRLLTDFLMIYSIKNLLCLPNTLKKIFKVGSTDNESPSTSMNRQSLFYYKLNEIERPSNLTTTIQPHVDKLNEIYELRSQNYRSSSHILDVLLNSHVIRNIVPSMKWALWRRLLVYVVNLNSQPLYCAKKPTNNYRQYNKLMESSALMLGFFFLDRDNSMVIKPEFLKKLFQLAMNAYLDVSILDIFPAIQIS